MTIKCNESRQILRQVVFVIAFFGTVALQSTDVFAQTPEPSARWKSWLKERMKEPTSLQFPRFSWASFGYAERQAKDADFAAYASAGFTEVQSILKPDFLQAASQQNLNLILGTWEKSLDN